ncbi:MAG: hypothetical protein AAB316_11590 [Bacteroidota bacterium]|mgnify:CR=1 FL=1
MKKRLLSCFLLLFWLKSFAQLGITVAPTSNRALDWQVVVENFLTHRRTDFLEHGTTAVFDYALPFKSQVVKFQPGIYLSRATVGYHGHSFETYFLGVQFNTGIYPFLSKKSKSAAERDFFERTWFQLSPGLSLATLKYDQPQFKDGKFTGEYKRFDDHQLSFNLGAQVAVDFQLSDFLTVSPLAGIRYFPKLTWDGFTEAVSKGNMIGTFDQAEWRQITLGLRMSLQLKKAEAIEK